MFDFIIKLLVMKRKSYSKIVRNRKKYYIVTIKEYESATEALKKWNVYAEL